MIEVHQIVKAHQQVSLLRVITSKKTGKHLVSCGNDGQIKIWDGNLQCVKVLTGHKWAVTDVCIVNRTMLWSTSLDRTVRIWELWVEGNGSWCPCVNVIQGSSAFHCITTIDDEDEHPVVAIGSYDRTVQIREAETHELIRQVRLNGIVWGLCFVRVEDGMALFKVAAACGDATIEVLTTHGNDCVLRGHEMAVRTIATMPCRGLLLSGSDDCSIRLWDVLRGFDCVGQVVCGGGCVRSLTVMNEQHIAAGDTSGHVNVIQILSSPLLHDEISVIVDIVDRLNVTNGHVRSVASFGNDMLLAAAESGTISQTHWVGDGENLLDWFCTGER